MNLPLLIYLIIGCFYAGRYYEDHPNYPVKRRILMTIATGVVALPIMIAITIYGIFKRDAIRKKAEEIKRDSEAFRQN